MAKGGPGIDRQTDTFPYISVCGYVGRGEGEKRKETNAGLRVGFVGIFCLRGK